MKITLYPQFILLIVLVSSFGTNTLPKDLIGKWKTCCNDSSGFVNIIDNENILIEVNSNQIYIKSKGKYRFKSQTSSILEIYLVEPDDLGLGGMKLNWNSFSKTHKIAEIRLFKNQPSEFLWFGFYDKKKKKYLWHKEMDFLLKQPFDYPICIKKCES